MITRIIGVRHSIAEDAVAGLRLVLEAGCERAEKIAKILMIQLVDQKAIVLCSPRLEAFMTAMIIATLCDELTVITHPDFLDPFSFEPLWGPRFIIDEAEKHEATTVIIVQHGGQIEQTCPDVADELGHQVGFKWEEKYLEHELDYAEAVVLDLETDGIKISYLNSPE